MMDEDLERYNGACSGEEIDSAIAITMAAAKVTGILKGDGKGGVMAQEVDTTPTANSTNPVTSGGVYATNLALAREFAAANAHKLDKPEDAGEPGQVLTLGDDGKPAWADAQGGGLLPVLEVTVAGFQVDSITATLGSKTVALTYDSASDVWTGELPSLGMWTVTAKFVLGKTASKTVDIAAITTYLVEIQLGTYGSLIPVMTSNTEPSGTASANANNDRAYLAFDGKNEGDYNTAGYAGAWYTSYPYNTGHYVQYTFPKSALISLKEVGLYGTGDARGLKMEVSYKLRNSTDFVVIGTIDATGYKNTEVKLSLPNPVEDVETIRWRFVYWQDITGNPGHVHEATAYGWYL